LVIVPDYQLSLAIGKEGQNARLAARLTGLRIDIKSESQAFEEEAASRAAAATSAASPPVSQESKVAEIQPAPAAEEESEASGSPMPGTETAPRCAALLSSGERCMNPARPGSDYCGIPAHQKQARSA
jgi:N utilization substance protein A